MTLIRLRVELNSRISRMLHRPTRVTMKQPIARQSKRLPKVVLFSEDVDLHALAVDLAESFEVELDRVTTL